MVKTQELRDLSDDELQFRCGEARKELFRLKNQMRKNNKERTPHVLPQKRREVARLLTLIHERKIAQTGN